MEVGETIDARKAGLGPEDLAEVLSKAKKVLAAKGKKIVEIDMSRAVAPDLLHAAVLGRSGTLRAPVARVGKTFLVGFNLEVWREELS